MAHRLTDAEWADLVELIAASPADRINQALKCIVIAPRHLALMPQQRETTHTRTAVAGRLIHLATVSSGAAFDRALLTTLRRLSVH